MGQTDHHDERFDALWRDHYGAVVAYGLRREPGYARDLAADVFLVVWRRLDEVPADARPWLIAVARNLLANHRRGARRRLGMLMRLAGERPGTAPDPADMVGDAPLREALGSLSASDREVIALSAWDGLDPEGLGAALGVRPRTASVRLHRARRRLAAALAEREADPALTPRPASQESSP